MALDIAKHAFTAGEVSDNIYGRSDLDNYDLALATCLNYFVDFRGGVASRAGYQFVDFIMHDDKPVKLVPFKFSPTIANTYAILFGDEYIRFVQDGGYVLEDPKTITAITQASPGVVTSAAHGFANGDWLIFGNVAGMVDLAGRTVVVAGATTNTFSLLDTFGNPIDTSGYAAFVSGEIARVYTIASPYAAEDLATLHAKPSRDLVRLTHNDYPIYNLIRNDHTDWDLEEEDINTAIASPGAPTLEPSSSGSAGIVFAVSAVSNDGEESLPSPKSITQTSVNYSTTAGSLTLTWPAVAGAKFYKIYRSTINPKGADTTRAEELGYIGRSYGPIFTDTNIIPDFTSGPPEKYNPFANGAVRSIAITNGGSGYPTNATVSISGGTGFIGYPVVDPDGAIVSVVIINGGEGYTSSSTVTFSGTGGSGATGTVDATPLTGNNPAESAIFQQRQIYAGTPNQPLGIWGSKPGRFSNFDTSSIITDADSYEFEVGAEEASPILHLVPTRSGMLVMTQSGIWSLSAGQYEAVTPTNALADPQTYNGVAPCPPLQIDTDILYVEGKGSAVRLLEYNDYSKVYASKTVSILSNHLMSNVRPIDEWAYASDPFKVIWGVRRDGAMLGFTMLKEEKVFGWSRHTTRGLFRHVTSIPEGNTDSIYVVVHRLLAGRWTQTIERQAPRTFEVVEDAWCVDCGLALPSNAPEADLIVSGSSGTVTFTASTSVFTSGDVGRILRMSGMMARVTGYTSGTQVTGTVIRPALHFVPETNDEIVLPAAAGTWTLDTPTDEVGGLWHLEGETLVALCDGNVVKNLLVTGGKVTLPYPCTRVIIGLPYRCIARTLPLATAELQLEGKRKRIVSVGVRVASTRGLKVGAALTSLYEMKDRTNENWGEATRLQNGVKTQIIDSKFDEDGQVYIVQDNPLPATILGLVLTTDIGDPDESP